MYDTQSKPRGSKPQTIPDSTGPLGESSQQPISLALRKGFDSPRWVRPTRVLGYSTMSYGSINAHREMALDHKRNDAYYRALKKMVTPTSVIMDLGAGIGICGLMAAELGAKRVYLVEPENVVHAAALSASEAARKRIKIVQDRIERIRVSEPVDVIVSVLTGNFLLAEDLLPSLFNARDRFLRHGGKLIPDAASMVIAPVHAPKKHDALVAAWSLPQNGVNLSALRAMAANNVHYVRRGLADFHYLAPPESLRRFDFYRAEDAACDSSRQFVAERSALCHGLLGWFDMRLDDKWVSTGPGEPRMHWAAAYLPLDPPLDVTKGGTLDVRVVRPQHGDWSWQVKAHGEERRHSTFLGSSLTPDLIQKSQSGYRPQCSIDGRLVLYVLSCFDKGMTISEIRDAALEKFGDHFGDRGAVARTVARLVAQYG